MCKRLLGEMPVRENEKAARGGWEAISLVQLSPAVMERDRRKVGACRTVLRHSPETYENPQTKVSSQRSYVSHRRESALVSLLHCVIGWKQSTGMSTLVWCKGFSRSCWILQQRIQRTPMRTSVTRGDCSRKQKRHTLSSATVSE